MVIYAARDLTHRRQGRDLLAMAVQEQYGISPLPSIERETHGKPYFPHFPQIHFNLSHSGSLALCALDVFPMGVDIQTVAPHRPAMRERCCSPAERTWLADRGDSWEDFTLLWTMKEALVKQRGTGLIMPISTVNPPLPQGNEDLLHQEELCFRLYTGEGWRAAICSCTTPPAEWIWKMPFVEKNL